MAQADDATNTPRPDRLENLKTLRRANLDGAFATAFLTLIGGNFLVGFIKTEIPGGAADLWIGLLSSIPSFLGLIQIPGAILGRSHPSYKSFISLPATIWRLLHIPLALLPILALAANVKMAIALGCLSLAAAVVNIVNPIYNDWLAEMIPENSRGSFFATRNSIVTAIGSSVGLLGGLTVDFFKNHDQVRIGYSVIFGIGFIFSLVSMYFFMQMQDIPRENVVKQSVKEGIKAFGEPFADKGFRKVLLFLSLFVWGQSMAGPLWSAFAFESLNFSQTQLQLCGIMHALGNIVMSRFWGYLADKYGNKPVLTLCAFGMVLSPVAWLLAQPGPGATTFNLVLLISTHFLMGANWAGVATCQFNLLLSTADPKNRGTYIGAGLATQALIGGIAPMVGASLLSSFRGMGAFEAYHMVIWITMGVRVVSILALGPIQEVGSTSVRETVRVLRGVTPKGIRAMRRFSRSGDAIEREHAIEKMGNQGLSLASSELISALHDPSPRVRRQAATALGSLGDLVAVPELIHQLHEHPDLVEEETVEALGALGDPQALPELINLLQSPRPLLRRASARAISMIPGATADQDAINALVSAAEDSRDPDLRRAALQALRNLEAPTIAATVSHALLDKHPSVRIAAAEAASEIELKDTADACRASITLYGDEAGAEVAYALGVVGNIDDVPRILAVAQTCVSMITRRRCLLGVARLFGVERAAYKALMTVGMERDKLLMSMLAVGAKSSKQATRALEFHAAGNEVEAVKALKLGKDADALGVFEVEESFVIACCIYQARMANRL